MFVVGCGGVVCFTFPPLCLVTNILVPCFPVCVDTNETGVVFRPFSEDLVFVLVGRAELIIEVDDDFTDEC